MSEEKRYAQLPRSSISLYAEAEGHSSLPDAAAGLLAEDSNYRLRQILQNATQFMRHSKRKRLTGTDVNQALQWSQVEPLYGYENTDSLPFTFLREADLFVPEDNDILLLPAVTEEVPAVVTKVPFLKLQWLAVEGVAKDQTPATPSAPDESTDSKLPSQKPPSEDVPKEKLAAAPQPHPQHVPVSECLMSYYDQITQAILGSDQDLLLVALEDLQTNDRLTPLLPYLLNFVSVGVKKMGHDLTQLTKLLHTIQSLVDNPSLYLGTQPYLTVLIQSVLYCVLEPLAASLNPGQDHWTFRNSAARLLVHTLRRWSTSTNQFWCHTGQILRDCFGDISKPFSAHYGALVSIQTMGLSEVESLVLPKLEGYWHHLYRALEGGQGVSNQVKADAHKVRGTLLLMCEHVLKRRLKCAFPEAWSLREQSLGRQIIDNDHAPRSVAQVSSGPAVQLGIKQEVPPQSNGLEGTLTLYKVLYEIFGDALAIRLPCLPRVTGIRPILPDRKKHVLSLGNPAELMQTGEEMLEAFYEGVCEDESARSPGNSIDEDNSYEENSPLSDEAPAVELQIRSTISDPALGIKLTIAKLRRDQAPPPVKEQPTKSGKRKKISKSDFNITDVFERCQLRPVFRPLVFNFEGGTPIPPEQLHRPALRSPLETPLQSWILNARMKKTGRKRPTVRTRYSKSYPHVLFII